MDKTALDVILRDSLEEFSKTLEGQTWLDLTKIDSIAETSNEIKEAFRNLFPSLKFGVDIDLVADLDTTSGLLIIEVRGRKDQLVIDEVEPINLKKLFEILEKTNEKRLLKKASVENTKNTDRQNLNNDYSDDRQIPLSGNGREEVLLDVHDGKPDPFENAVGVPVSINSICMESRQIHTSSIASSKAFSRELKFTVNDQVDIDVCNLAYTFNIPFKVSFKLNLGEWKPAYISNPKMDFDQSLLKLSSQMNQVTKLSNDTKLKIIDGISDLIEKSIK